MLNKILIVTFVAVVAINFFSVRGLSDLPAFAAQYEGKVVLYATSWCGYCEKTRRFLESENIPYIEHNIEASKAAMEEYRALGGRGVPLVLAGGEVIRGYNPRRIVKLMNAE